MTVTHRFASSLPALSKLSGTVALRSRQHFRGSYFFSTCQVHVDARTECLMQLCGELSDRRGRHLSREQRTPAVFQRTVTRLQNRSTAMIVRQHPRLGPNYTRSSLQLSTRLTLARSGKLASQWTVPRHRGAHRDHAQKHRVCCKRSDPTDETGLMCACLQRNCLLKAWLSYAGLCEHLVV